MNFNPIIIKPSASAGSRGVSFINKPDEISAAWKWTTEVNVFPILAEEFIEGEEYSVETISVDGCHEIAMITEKMTTGFPNFIEVSHHVPARLDTLTKNQVEKLVIDFLDLIQQKTGPTHTEIKLTKEGAKIIESQTRIGGDQIWEMTEMVSGIDQMTETICHLLQLPLPPRVQKNKAAAIQFFTHENKTIQHINNLDYASILPGIVRIKCKIKPGEKLGVLKCSDSRQGYVLATGDTVEDAIMNADKAINTVEFI